MNHLMSSLTLTLLNVNLTLIFYHLTLLSLDPYLTLEFCCLQHQETDAAKPLFFWGVFLL